MATSTEQAIRVISGGKSDEYALKNTSHCPFCSADVADFLDCETYYPVDMNIAWYEAWCSDCKAEWWERWECKEGDTAHSSVFDHPEILLEIQHKRPYGLRKGRLVRNPGKPSGSP